ncbi:hypothetical protein WME88_52860 [Sorangium sp. So ce216]
MKDVLHERLFALKLGARVAATLFLPFLTGPRDQLSYYEKRPLLTPDEPLGRFVRGVLREQKIEHKAAEVKEFLDAAMPAASRVYLGKAWLQLSVAAGEDGIGLAIFNSNQRIQDAFFAYLTSLGIDTEAARFSRALCQTLSPSAFGMLRAEFFADEPTRYSIFPGWLLDPFRGHDGFAESLRALPAAVRDTPLVRNAERLAAMQAPDLYPYGYGLSFTAGGDIELKLYTTRYDKQTSPLGEGSCLRRLIEAMGVPAAEMRRIQALHDRMWETCGTKAIQVSAAVSDRQVAPDRLALLYCGADLEVTKAAVREFGLVPEAAAVIDDFGARMKVDRAMYLGFGVSAAGLSKRMKLYDAAFFRDASTSVLTDDAAAPVASSSAPRAVGQAPRPFLASLRARRS